ncbi:serine/threonine-protein kinase [Nocardiopsis aegyptia]|uniref:non-specific serine/threonine protein kinase n=1 Tax=Nocardiopsis aegyptia TaxID=220378 RepID=A0A7Z0J8G9_9ACTN|nr:serine/threonine-protein kinase [Nocardiopsis aegyptia]NYJ32971.1 hypothetical protein [Nocardiopsis aegyptia]
MGSETEPHRTLRGRYALRAEIGRGGMGRVWSAHDHQLNRTVAVKEILLGPGVDEAERTRVAARAHREAQAAAMGGHPNIVTVHDIVEDDGRPWIVMEFLTGRSLHALVRQDGPCGHERTAAWGLDLLSALTAAHDQGILHRDVKPENVMVTDSGRVVLTDFGIATIADSTALTQTVGVVGSPGYLAPERLAMRPASPAGDLWSLGATLYFTATGVSPFHRDGLQATLHAVTAEEPADTLGPGPLGEAVRGMLAKDPARRADGARCRTLLTAAATASTARRHPVPAPTAPRTPQDPPVRPAPPGAADTTAPVPPGAAPTLTVPAPPSRRTGPSWPTVVLALGLATLVAATALIVVLDPLGDDGTALQSEPGTSTPLQADAGDDSAADDPDAAPGETAAAPEEDDDQDGDGTAPPQDGAEPAAEGMTWTADPDGFHVLVPDGWTRRTDGSSVYYDSPDADSYLQVDLASHPTDDEYQHVLDQEDAALSSGRLPDYTRVGVRDRTAGSDYHSVAAWEFTWDRGDQVRHVLAVNIAVSPGTHCTIAWAAPAGQWDSQDAPRTAAVESFLPPA